MGFPLHFPARRTALPGTHKEQDVLQDDSSRCFFMMSVPNLADFPLQEDKKGAHPSGLRPMGFEFLDGWPAKGRADSTLNARDRFEPFVSAYPPFPSRTNIKSPCHATRDLQENRGLHAGKSTRRGPSEISPEPPPCVPSRLTCAIRYEGMGRVWTEEGKTGLSSPLQNPAPWAWDRPRIVSIGPNAGAQVGTDPSAVKGIRTVGLNRTYVD